MKQTKNLFLFLLVASALLTLNLHCEKNKREGDPITVVLPPATTIGANTFGCEIDGVVWNATEINMDYWNGDFVIHPKRKAPFKAIEDIAIQTIQEFFDTGYYELKYYDTCLCTPTVFAEFFDGSSLYKLPSGVPLKMQLTRFDTINSIISGRFDFDLKKETSGEIVHIRNGRFDVKYK